MKTPDRIYDRLTPEERGRAFIEAAANLDVEELERLNATCPVRSYHGEDEAYTRFKYGSMIVTLMTNQKEQQIAEAFYLALVQATCEDGAVVEKATASVKHFLARYLEMQTAFELFCDSIGVNAASLRAAHTAKLSGYINLMADSICVDDDQDPGRVAADLALMKSWWEAVT